jgi:hypothetical protein
MLRCIMMVKTARNYFPSVIWMWHYLFQCVLFRIKDLTAWLSSGDTITCSVVYNYCKFFLYVFHRFWGQNLSFEYVLYTQFFLIILHIKFNMIHIGYVTMKLFVVCHTVPSGNKCVSTWGDKEEWWGGGGPHFMGIGLGQKLQFLYLQNAYNSMFHFE